ncbi:MAG TPA: response regulator, partial [Opitutus sp.]|nr:response regulator [Opitutus sp.]
YEVDTAGSEQTARGAHQRQAPDLMLLDLKLPDGRGAELVASLQRERTPVPFVVVTGQGDEKVAVEVMKQGALDYVMKDAALLDLLPAVVKHALATVQQSKALAHAQAEHRRLEQEILAVGERERHSIGADLHDNLGQQLTALELMCTALKEDAVGHPTLTSGLERMGRMLREAVTQTRALARGLVPVGSEPDALQNGLTELAERINALGRVRCRLECPEPVLVPEPFVAGHLYRIAQEAVNNAIKHGRPRTVVIRLSRDPSSLHMEIADDGTGLGKPKAGQRAGVGLGVMQHRANVIGAELTLNSKRGAGLTVRCTWPLPA